MNYVGTFGATSASDGQGTQHHASVHADSIVAHAPADSIIVPDAQLLFHGDFHRSGVDLILSGDEREFVVHDYFKSGHRKALSSPDGAHLTAGLVNALTGEVDISQADNAGQAGKVIGHVTKLVGSGTVVRNGVSIIINIGDNVEKGDLVQSGSDTTIGITFIDGTVFGLSSNARMVLNEMVYDPNGSNNSSLLSLVAGTITFVAGETAKHGDMKIDTPVATMGIRGTAVLVEIDFTVPSQNGQPNASFQVLVEPDGTTGSYVLFDKLTLQPIAIVDKAGLRLDINQQGITQSNTQLSPDILKLINGVFEQKFTDATNPNSTTHFTDSVNPFLIGQTISLKNGTTATPIFLVTGATLGSGTPPTPAVLPAPTRFDQAPTVTSSDLIGNLTTNFFVNEFLGKTGFSTSNPVSGVVNFVDSNSSDRPTVAITFDHATYQGHAGGGSLQAADILATEIQLTVIPGSGNNNNGTALWTYSLPDKAFDFLGAGETLTLTYDVTVNNNFAQAPLSATFPITITITGTNDAPVVTTGPQSITFSGSTGGPLQTLPSSGPTFGKFAFTDVDLTDKHTVAVSLETPVLTEATGKVVPIDQELLTGFEQALTATIESDSTGTGKGLIDWTFSAPEGFDADIIPEGDTLTFTYDVTVTDPFGGTSKQQVTVTIVRAAFIWVATTTPEGTSGGFWSDGKNWQTTTVPTATDDVIIVTNQAQGLTPTFPATIDSETSAAAHSLTMNDFNIGLSTPPTLINQGTFAVGPGGISLNADAVIDNEGWMSVAGAFKFHDQDPSDNPPAAVTLTNTGTLVLSGGGDFTGLADVTNTGTFELAAGTLNVSVDITNFDISDLKHKGTFQIDDGATLALTSGSLNGGIVTNGAGGTIDFNGAGVLSGGTLVNNGNIFVSGAGNKWDAENVTANASLEITFGGSLTIDQGSAVANTQITVDSGGTLALMSASLKGGTVTNVSGGEIDFNGAGVLSGGTLVNNGDIFVSGAGNKWDAENVTVNGGTEVTSGGSLTIDQDTTVANTDTTVDFGGTLVLTSASLNGGAVTNSGTIDFNGAAVLSGGILFNDGNIFVSGTANKWDAEHVTPTNVLANGTLEITSGGSLTIDQGSTVADTQTSVDSGGSLTLMSASFIGGTVTNSGTIDFNGAAVLSGGTLENNGHIFVSGAGNTWDAENVTANGGTEITSGGSLTIDQDSTVANGDTTIDSAGTLTLTSASLNGGTVTNATGGTIDFNGAAILSGGTLANNGHIFVSGAGNTWDAEKVTANASLEIMSGGSLTIDQGSTVANTQTTVDSGGTLALTSASLNGGIVTNASGGEIDFNGAAVLSGGTLKNDGDIIISGTANKWDAENVTANASLEITSGGALTIDLGSTVANTQTTVDSTGTLTLTSASLNGGTVTNNSGGSIDLNGAAVLSGGTLANNGHIFVSGAANKWDAENVTANASLEITSGGALTIDQGSTVANTQTTVDSAGTLILTSASLNGGTVTNTSGGTIDLSGNAVVSGGSLANNGHIFVSGTANKWDAENVTANASLEITSGGALTIDQGSTVANTQTTVDSAGTLTLKDTSFITGGVVTNGGTLNLQGTSELENGTLATTGAVNVSGSGVIFNDQQVTNNGTSPATDIIDITGALTLQNNSSITNGAGNDVTVEMTGTLTLADTSFITGGIVTDKGMLNLQGTSELENGTLAMTGVSNVTGSNVIFSAETVTNTGTATAIDIIDITGALTLENNSSIANGASNIVKVEAGASLTFDDSTMTGGKLNNSGTVAVETAGTTSIFDGVTVTNTGTSANIQIDVSAPTTTTLRLDDGTSINQGKMTIGSSGILEVSSALGAALTGVSVSNSYVVEVDAGSLLMLNGSTITGGKLNNSATVAIETAGTTSTFDGVTVTNTGADANIQIDVDLQPVTLKLDDGASITGGKVTIGSSGILEISSTSGATLSGVTVNNSNIVQVDAGSKLLLSNDTFNGGTLSGTGPIATTSGNTETTLNGVTIASGSKVTAAVGVLDLTGTITDTGGEVDATTGTIDLDGATFNGGTLGGGGTVNVVNASTIEAATLSGATVNVNAALTLNGDTVTGTTIADKGGGIILDNTVKLSGGATIEGQSALLPGAITNLGTLEISGTATLLDETLTNTSHTVHVDATTGVLNLNTSAISAGTLNIDGELDSNGTSFLTGVTIDNTSNIKVVTGTLTIDPAPFTNTGTIEVENGATLVVNGETITNSVTDPVTHAVTNGTIQVDGTDSTHFGTVDFEGSTLNGGNLYTSAWGVLDSTGTSFITNASFANGGATDVVNGTLTLNSTTVSGNGSVTVESKSALDLLNATFNGGTLGGPGTITTVTGNTASTLNGVTLKSGSKVTAAAGALNLTGTLMATGAEIDANVGTGIGIELESLVLLGGTLGGLGTIATASAANTFNSVTVASVTTVTVTDHTTLELKGTIDDAGTIALNASGDSTQLEISGSVTLNGSGHVTLTDDTHNAIVSDGSAATLNNADTITGAGTIGDINLTLSNSGTIDATGSHALIIDTGVNTSTAHGLVGSLSVTNTGILEAAPGHTLQIDDNVVNNGLIQAGSSGSNSAATVDITGNITGTGSIDLFNHATVEVGGSVSSGETVNFESAGGGSLLILDDSHHFSGTITGLTEFGTESLENHVDLRDLAYRAGHMSSHYSGGVLTISNGLDSVTLHVTGSSDPAFEFASDGNGSTPGTLVDDPSPSGPVTIDSGHTLDIFAASTAAVTFTNSNGNTGALVLWDSKEFTGTITGFTGDGTPGNSDTIDLQDINFAKLTTEAYTENASGTGGTLTLSDGATTTSINFLGNYALSNFNFSSDGDGGTLLSEAPANSGAQSGASSLTLVSNASMGVSPVTTTNAATIIDTVSASNGSDTLTGNGGVDQFVFAPTTSPTAVQHTITNFNTNLDTINLQQFGNTVVSAADLIANHTTQVGNDTLIAIDSNDSILLKNVQVANLHASDFAVHV